MGGVVPYSTAMMESDGDPHIQMYTNRFTNALVLGISICYGALKNDRPVKDVLNFLGQKNLPRPGNFLWTITLLPHDNQHLDYT